MCLGLHKSETEINSMKEAINCTKIRPFPEIKYSISNLDFKPFQVIEILGSRIKLCA